MGSSAILLKKKIGGMVAKTGRAAIETTPNGCGKHKTVSQFYKTVSQFYKTVT